MSSRPTNLWTSLWGAGQVKGKSGVVKMFSYHKISIIFNGRTIFEAKEVIEGIIFDDRNGHIIVCHDSSIRSDNVVCLDRDGNELWRLGGQRNVHFDGFSPYTYITVDSQNGCWAYSFNGYDCRFDPQNGEVLEYEWVG